MHRHRTPTICETCAPWPDWARRIVAHLNFLEEIMTEVSADQQHLDQDVNALGTAFAAVVQELKDQWSQGKTLDFTAADALVAQVQGEAAADAPASDPGTPPADDSGADVPPADQVPSDVAQNDPPVS